MLNKLKLSTFAGFRLFFHKNEFGQDNLPPLIIFVNETESEQGKSTFEETKKDGLHGKFVAIPFD